MESTPNVVIFDSGVGALSIIDAMIQQQIQCNICIIADSEFYPYGSKSADVLSSRICHLISVIIRQQTVDVIVLGCNTISTLLLDELRTVFDIPIIGVVPAVKPAAQLTNSSTFAVLATQVTIEGNYLRGLIDEFAVDKKVKLLACNELVVLAEQKLMGSIDTLILTDNIRIELDELIVNNQDINTLVLACTHFPLLREEINSIYPDIKLIDSAEAIANRVQYLLTKTNLNANVDNKNIRYRFLVTDNKYQRSNLSVALATRGIEKIEEIKE